MFASELDDVKAAIAARHAKGKTQAIKCQSDIKSVLPAPGQRQAANIKVSELHQKNDMEVL